MNEGLLQRLESNANRLQGAYASGYQLLDVAVTDAMPWVLGLPIVQSRIPEPLRPMFGRGRPVRLEDLELLTTRLLAILQASEPSAMPAASPPFSGSSPAQAIAY